jgi:putative ABC transport system permease protein
MLIVGVAPTIRHDLFETTPEAHIYRSTGSSPETRLFLYARAAGQQTAGNIVDIVREQLRAVDAGLPVMFVKTFRAQHEGSAQIWILRVAAKMFLTLGLAAAFVAVIGLYGVRSYLVSRRTREFGVRMAIGASPLDVLRLVLREAIVTTAAGLAIGLALGVMLGWGLSFLIYQVSPYDPITLGGATALLALSSLAASIIPARRASNVMPMAALRND